MSILIKGMEMPDNCRDRHMPMEWCNKWIGVEDGKRSSDCPLIPVPPHGRLIDADALKEASHYDDHNVCVVDADDIDNAMTVIPADFAKDTNVPNKRGDGKSEMP